METLVDNSTQFFLFETDFAGTLRCIPMIVRFKLDHVGIKLSLKQWCKFSHEERNNLVNKPCFTAEQIDIYKDYLARLIEIRAKEEAKSIAIDIDPEWGNIDYVPERLIERALTLDIQPPTQNSWSQLDHLQRFALFKLTRPGHDNDNFIPAMQEFGLLKNGDCKALS